MWRCTSVGPVYLLRLSHEWTCTHEIDDLSFEGRLIDICLAMYLYNININNNTININNINNNKIIITIL